MCRPCLVIALHLRCAMCSLSLCSLCTTLSLHWEPQTIAVAFLYLAAKLSKTSIHTLCGTRKSWWRQFVDTVDEHDLEGK